IQTQPPGFSPGQPRPQGAAPLSSLNASPGTARSGAAQLSLTPGVWTPIGPAGINNSQVPGKGVSSGRITGLAADPSDPNTIYIAAAGGGVWKTTDGGTTWTPLTDNQPTLVMGALAIAPSNPSVLYAGTGEGDNSADSFYGLGILKSMDA